MSTSFLVILLFALVIVSGFFSSTETGIMSINRYRLRHQVRKNHPSAIRVDLLLRRPDRLLAVILIGNTFANVFASTVATILAARFFKDVGVAFAAFGFSLVLLIMAEVTPKTLAAIYPELIAYPASYVLRVLLVVLRPFVWMANKIANSLLALFKVKMHGSGLEALSRDELRTVVNEAAGKRSAEYQEMLLGILDLNRVRVEDIMVPRNEIVGINLDDDWDVIQKQLHLGEHTRMPLYRGSIEQMVGMVHMRKVLNLFAQDKLDKTSLQASAEDIYMIPEATPLNKLLVNFRTQKCRIGLVVNEYGDFLGLATLEDILEEIVGEFTTDIARSVEEVRLKKDGSFKVDGGANLRDLNRNLGWVLPTQGPKTLSGLIIEHLEAIPNSKVCLKINGYPMEVLRIENNMIESVLIWPALRELDAVEDFDSVAE